MFDFYINDNIDAVNAKFEAQKIAFAPLSFQAARALRNLGILDEISNARKKGIKISELSQKLNISLYGIGVLVEMGLGMGAIKVHKDSDDDDLRLTLGKIGFFLMKDEMTQVNMDFSQDICYRGAENLEESILKGKPAGLPHLGPWKTVYEGLSQLTEQEKKSWFGFDHFYSDSSFEEALKIVFDEHETKSLVDVGGNTGRWAMRCVGYSDDVRVTIMDLPQQLEMMRSQTAGQKGADRIEGFGINLLDRNAAFPQDRHFDAIWMSQFLDCFSEEEILSILQRAVKAMDSGTRLYIMETFWDRQRYEAATLCLTMTSLYFTAIANGNSKMYHSDAMERLVNKAGMKVERIYDIMGQGGHSIMVCTKE